MSRAGRGRKRRLNPGWFKKGHDPRRHQLTHEERVRGGKTTFRKFLVLGRWSAGWWERCHKRKKEDHDDEKDLYQDEQTSTGSSDDLPF